MNCARQEEPRRRASLQRPGILLSAAATRGIVAGAEPTYHCGRNPLFRRPIMRMLAPFLSVALFTLLPATFVAAEVAVIGSAAPDFHLTSADGQPTSLSQFKGKTVVLEWYNPGCPFVKKFYSRGDMQRLQRTARDKGAVWLTISSSAEGKQGHISQKDAPGAVQSAKLESAALLLDPSGAVGREYGARTTPHIFVIDPKGTLVYAGAIDSEPSTDPSDVAGATNYALLAIDSIAAGKPIEPSSTEPYGCSVKY